MPVKFDIVLRNGDFWTGNAGYPHARTVGIKSARIALVTDETFPDLSSGLNLDLEGHFCMPGFIDAHTHLRSGGATFRKLNLRQSRSQPELAEMVRNAATAVPVNKWITGSGWDNESWGNRQLPAKDLIDKFTPRTPVFLDRIDMHAALVNSFTLHLAGITRDTPDPPGGVILRDSSGEPMGIVKDAAREMILKFIPEPTFDDRVLDAKSAAAHANRLGVTSVHDMSPEEDTKAFVELMNKKELTVRIYSVPPISEHKLLVDAGIQADHDRTGNEWIKHGAVKAFADGSLGSDTAWFFEPYENDGQNSGNATAMMSSGELERLAIDADRCHIQLAIHAVGDKAVSRTLDIFEEVTKQNPPWDRRFRIEHVQHVRPFDFPRFGKLGVLASVQPYHCIDDGRWALGKIGIHRAETTFAFRQMIDQGIPLAFGTDWPVAPLNPLKGIHAAVTRATIDGKNPGGWIPQQRIKIEEALKAYTLGSAHASFSEREKGTIEVGKLADLVILSQNPFEVEPDEIREIKILMTIFGGRIVYGEAQFAECYDRFSS